jgi:hypothetical protein
MGVILGADSNAHSPKWGGDRLDPKGRLLEDALQNHQLTLLNDGLHHTFSGRGILLLTSLPSQTIYFPTYKTGAVVTYSPLVIIILSPLQLISKNSSPLSKNASSGKLTGIYLMNA